MFNHFKIYGWFLRVLLRNACMHETFAWYKYIIIVIIIITILYQTIDLFNFGLLTINLSKTYLKFFLRPKYRMNENISICVMSKEFSLDIFFKQAWNDPRLVHELKKPILLSGSDKSNFWLPDTFFLNVKTAKFHHVPAANSRIAINPNGDVELSERYGVDDFLMVLLFLLHTVN